jgi:hypothetical protein
MRPNGDPNKSVHAPKQGVSRKVGVAGFERFIKGDVGYAEGL